MNSLQRACLLFCCLIFASAPVYAQVLLTPGEYSGDSAVAMKYTEAAIKAIEADRWDEALTTLERARDFAGVSSDISYLLALVRNRFNQPLWSVVQVLDEALGAARWRIHSPEEARYLKAELLIRLKQYHEAINVIASLPSNHKTACLKMRALCFLTEISSVTAGQYTILTGRNRPSHEEFRSLAAETIERYPRESEPVRIYFNFIKMQSDIGNLPEKQDMEILDKIFQRLPLLIETDPEIAWMSAPFLNDKEQAHRNVSAYHAGKNVNPFSLPASLSLGVIDETLAINELFNLTGVDIKSLDLRLLNEIYNLLSRDESRRLFRSNLSVWSGVIRDDRNGDGFYETVSVYRNGLPLSFNMDFDQDGIPELAVNFEAGEPRTAEIYTLPEANPHPPMSNSEGENGRQKVFIIWERYPALQEARIGNEFFYLRPMHLNYAPVDFRSLTETAVIFPEAAPAGVTLGRRSLVVNSIRLERPSREFPGALEIIELGQGIPINAKEYFEGRVISETDFLRGRPLAQRVDLDRDGRMETVRFFRRNIPAPGTTPGGALAPVESLLDYPLDFSHADSDWDGDGIYERKHYN